MSWASVSVKKAGVAVLVLLVAVSLLYACRLAAEARPLGEFQDLTGIDGYDTMPDMKVDMSDSAHIVYQSYDGEDNDIYYMTNASGAWETTRITDDPLNDAYPELQLDGNNDPHVTWAHWDGADYEIYYATNAGGSWVTSAVTDNGLDDVHPSLDLASSPTLNSVSALDSDTAWAVGDEGLILKTGDGGATWTVQERGAPGAADLNGVVAVSASTAWAVGDGGTILSTVNGGAEWSAQDSRAVSDLYDVTADDADTAWAVGMDGTILFTGDGGASWSAQNSATRNDLHAVTGTADGGLWATGGKGTILHTADGGARWSGQATSTIADLTSVSAADADTAWAVGTGGVIIFTDDAGATWSAQDSGMIDDFTHVSAAGAGQAWAVGLCGSIYRTEDGGFTWDETSTGYATRLYGVDSASADHVWAVGSDSMILTSAGRDREWGKQDSGVCGSAWISFENYDSARQRTVIQTCSNTGGAWGLLQEVETEVNAKSPSLAISEDGETGHMAMSIQDGGGWRIFYHSFEASTGTPGYGMFVPGDTGNQLNPSIQLVEGKPVIAFQGWNGEDGGNYDIYLSSFSIDFSTSRLTATSDSEYEPALNVNPYSEEFCIGYQGCTASMDFYPGLIRYDPDEGGVMNDAYTELAGQTPSRAVAIHANDSYNVHFCCAARYDDMDIHYGYLSPSPWVYGVDAVGPGSAPSTAGEAYEISGTDLGESGTVYIHVFVETSPGQWEDREVQASVENWTPTSIILMAPAYDLDGMRPASGPVRVRAYGRDSNTDVPLPLP